MREFLKKFKEVYKDPKGKAFLFFGFYFFFFLGISLFFRMNHTATLPEVVPHEEEIQRRYRNELIRNNNYSYTYKITIDEEEYVYTGKRDGSRELFTYLNKEYYRSGNYCFCLNSTWEECEDPYYYLEYLDSSILFSLIDSAYFESITSYESGKNSIRYRILGSVIDEVVYQEKTDYADEGNSIIVNTNKDQEVYQMYFNFDSYGVTHNLCQKSFRLSFEYDQFGEVSKIVNPMD